MKSRILLIAALCLLPACSYFVKLLPEAPLPANLLPIFTVAVDPPGGVRVARLLIGATLAWYVMLLVFVEIRTMPVAMLCLLLAGMAQSLSMISAAVILMRTASAHLRGRVMGVRMLVIYGLPLGLLAAGSLIDLIGYTATGTLYAASGFLAMAAIVLHWRADLWPVHAPANAR